MGALSPKRCARAVPDRPFCAGAGQILDETVVRKPLQLLLDGGRRREAAGGELDRIAHCILGQPLLQLSGVLGKEFFGPA